MAASRRGSSRSAASGALRRRLLWRSDRPSADGRCAHARRKLFEVLEATRSPIAEEGLRRIQELDAIEAEINGMAVAQRLAVRQAYSEPLLIALQQWLEAQRRRISGKTALGRALQYPLSRGDALARYATDGRVGIDNNLAERLLRGIAVTRKSYLFVGSDAGGHRAAVLYTPIESAKLNSLNPEAYLADIIDRMARGHPNTRLAELLPWRCQPASSASASPCPTPATRC